jgi:ectoine hydroxylase-related dioxygenase (phytanoyl-CoA dioxygenase family)
MSKAIENSAILRIDDRLVFEFDLQGYLIVKNFIDSSTVARITEVLNRNHTTWTGPKFNFMTLDTVFLDIMSDRRILRFCNEWIDPHFRFDHAWGIHYPKGAGATEQYENLHAGPYQNQKFFQYHWHNARPICSCLLFGIVLEPQRAGDGGLVVVPGSHKTNMDVSGYRVFSEFCAKDLDSPPWISQPVLDAGDMLVMTEALVHGTRRWVPKDRPRRILYYKYSCSFMTWPPSDNAETVALRSMIRSEVEERLLEPPYVSVTTGDNLLWRRRTFDERD